MRFPNLTSAAPRRKAPPVQPGRTEGIVVAWAAPRPAFLLAGDAIYQVQLFGCRWWPQADATEYFGTWDEGTGVVQSWPAEQVMFTEGAALRERAIRQRPLRAVP